MVSISLLSAVLLAFGACVVAAFCHDLIEEAAASHIHVPTLVPLFVALLGFVAAATLVLWFQAMRLAQRLAGPAYRLVKSMERIRGGDISFRVHLRRGDHLTEVAAEMNSLLDWLNANPPRGVKTGGDLVRVGRVRSSSPRDDLPSSAPNCDSEAAPVLESVAP